MDDICCCSADGIQISSMQHVLYRRPLLTKLFASPYQYLSYQLYVPIKLHVQAADRKQKTIQDKCRLKQISYMCKSSYSNVTFNQEAQSVLSTKWLQVRNPAKIYAECQQSVSMRTEHRCTNMKVTSLVPWIQSLCPDSMLLCYMRMQCSLFN